MISKTDIQKTEPILKIDNFEEKEIKKEKILKKWNKLTKQKWNKLNQTKIIKFKI